MNMYADVIDSIFHIVYTHSSRASANYHVKEFPVIVQPDYGVFEPALLFLRELEDWRSASSGTLVDTAYIICLWCNHLQDIDRSWNEPSEVTYHSWLKRELVEGRIARARQARKANVILRWYHFLASRNIGGVLLRSFAASISASPLSVAEIHPKSRFKAPRGPKLKFGKRPIPDAGVVQRVADALANHENSFLAERNWLLGRTAYETGLRAMGLESLTCRMLDDMLREDAIIGEYQHIEAMAQDRPAKAAVRSALRQVEGAGRENLFALVTEKRGKSRNVAFPIPLVGALLEHVWGERAGQIRLGSRRQRAAGHLWISEKSARPLKRNSIKDILRIRGFIAANAKGSGHSLRAAHITNMACYLLAESKQKSGADFDKQAILFALAEIAGHSDPSTLEPYLEGARVRAVLMGDEAFIQMHCRPPLLENLGNDDLARRP